MWQIMLTGYCPGPLHFRNKGLAPMKKTTLLVFEIKLHFTPKTFSKFNLKNFILWFVRAKVIAAYAARYPSH